jgi:hypothetical protein
MSTYDLTSTLYSREENMGEAYKEIKPGKVLEERR